MKVTWDLERMKQAYLSLAAELGRPPLRQDMDQAAVAEPNRVPSSADYDLFFKGRQWLRQLASQAPVSSEPIESFETESLGTASPEGKKLPHTHDLSAWLSNVTPEQLNEYLDYPSAEWGIVGYYQGNGQVAQLRVVPVGDLKTFENHRYNFALKVQRAALDIQIVNTKGMHQAGLREVVTGARFERLKTETEKLLGRSLHPVELALLARRFGSSKWISDNRVDNQSLARWLQQVTPTELRTVLGNLPENWALIGSVEGGLRNLSVVTIDEKLSEHPSCHFKLTFQTTASGVRLVAAKGRDAVWLVWAIVREKLGRKHLQVEERAFIAAYMGLKVPFGSEQFHLPQNWRSLVEQLPGELPHEFVLYGEGANLKITSLAVFEDWKKANPRRGSDFQAVTVRREGPDLRPVAMTGWDGTKSAISMVEVQRGRKLDSMERMLIEVFLSSKNYSSYRVGDVEGLFEWLQKATPQQLFEIKSDWPSAFGLVGHQYHSTGFGQRVENLRVVPVEAMENLKGNDFGVLMQRNAEGYYSATRIVDGVVFDLSHIERRLNRPLDPVEKLLLSKRLGIAAQSVTLEAVQSWLFRVSPQELHDVIGEQPKDWVLAVELGAGGHVSNIRIVSDADAAKFSGLYFRPSLKHLPPSSKPGFVTVEALVAPLLAPIDGALYCMTALRNAVRRLPIQDAVGALVAWGAKLVSDANAAAPALPRRRSLLGGLLSALRAGAYGPLPALPSGLPHSGQLSSASAATLRPLPPLALRPLRFNPPRLPRLR